MKYIQKHIITLLTLLMLLVFGGYNTAIFAAGTLYGKTAVGAGKGTARVEIYSRYAPSIVIDSKETTGGDLVSVSMGVSKVTWGFCKFKAYPNDGYSFVAWYTNKACTSGKQTGSTYQPSDASGDKTYTYYAKFTANQYTITFKKQDGTGGTGSATVHFDNNDFSVATVSAPTRTGYTFGGYYTAANGGGVQIVNASGEWQSDKTGYLDANGKWIKAENTTVYAKWTANTYYVAFNGNGSTSGSMSNQTFTYNASAKKLTANAYSKTDVVTFDPNGGTCSTASISKSATFVGWATSADGAKVYDDQHSVSNLTSTAGATVNLFAKWSQTNTITLPNATKSGCVLAGWSDGSSNVGEAGATYSVPLNGITLTAIWIDKYTPVITGANHSMEVGDELTSAFSFEHTANPTAHISITSISAINNGNGKVIEYDAANNKIIAHNAGVATIYLEQAETETIKHGTSATYTYTVTKKANTLAVAAGTYSKYVDEEISPVVTVRNNTTTNLTTTSDAENVAHYDVANNKIVIPNSEAETFTSKVVTIHIRQAENYKYVAADKEIKVTVNKYANAVKVNGAANYSADVYYDDGLYVEFTSSNTNNPTAPYSVTPTSGTEYATYYDNEDGRYIWTAPTPGTARWTVTQAEDYKFLSASTTMTVNVIAAPAATDCYVLNRPAEQSLKTEIDDFGGVQGEVMQLSGPGATLTFKAQKNRLTSISNLFVEYSSDGVRWDDLNETALDVPAYSYGSFTYDISDLDVRYIRFEAKVGATYTKKIKDVLVTRKTYLTPSVSNLTVEKNGDAYIYANETASATFTLNWSCANGGDLHLSTNNPKFRVSPTTIQNVDCNTGTTTVTVYYDATSVTEETGTLYINNSVYSTSVNLTGRAILHGQSITWQENVEVMEEGAELDNAASAMTPVTYFSSNTSVINVINEGRTLVAVSSGTATITATAAASSIYAEATDSKIFTVTDEKPQYILWNQSLIGLHVGDPNVVLTATATSSIEECTTNEHRPISYTSGNESIVKIVNDNQLQIVGTGTTYVTAYQVGGEDADGHNYVAVSKDNKVVVTDPSGECEGIIPVATTSGTLFDLNTNKPQVQFDIELNPAVNGEPASVSFDTKTERFAGIWLSGNLILAQKLNGNWVNVRNFGTPTEGDYDSYTDITLNSAATAIRFYRPQGGEGYFDIANVQVKKARYIGASSDHFAMDTKVGETKVTTINVRYSNVVGPVTFQLSGANPNFSIDKVVQDADCGDHGNVNINVTYAPSAATAHEEDVLTITDGQTSYEISLVGSASITERTITWSPISSIYTIQTYTPSAVCKTGLDLPAGDVKYRVLASSTTGSLSGNVLSFDAAGYVDLQAYVDDNPRYNTPEPITARIQVLLTPTEITSVPSIETATAGTALDRLVLTGGEAQNTINNNTVDGSFSVISGNLNALGIQTVTVCFTPDNIAMYASSTRTTTMEVVMGAYVFNGSTGDEWNNASNWEYERIPGEDNDVIISHNVIISGDVEVKSLTIEEGSNVTLTVDGQLTVGDGDSKVLDGYGDLVVENGGKVILNDGELKVKDLIIEARLGDLEHSASSAEIDGEALLNVNGDVYFKLSFDPSGSISFGWYDFVVPFEVDVVGGIFLPSDTHTPLKNKVDYAIMEFSEEKYAAQQKFWLWNNTTLQPGKLYSITLDETKPYRNTFLFKRKGNATIGAPASYRPSCTNEAKNTNKGWNGMGNGTLKHRQLSLPKGANPRIQVYDHANDCYVTCDAKDFQYAIGTAFFVQVSSSETINLMEVNSNRNFRAPVHETETTDEFIVTLKEENAEIVSDRLWFSASEEATGEYIIGRDLVKMGEPKDAKVARMWAVRDDLRLCDAEMPLIYSEADCAIDLFAPKQATYILEVEQAPEDAELYLTYNGKVIWNLTASPSSIVLTQGTKEGYGLRIKSNKASTPQGIEDTNVENNTMRKVLIDNTMYVITPQGAMYNVTGKFVR